MVRWAGDLSVEGAMEGVAKSAKFMIKFYYRSKRGEKTLHVYTNAIKPHKLSKSVTQITKNVL